MIARTNPVAKLGVCLVVSLALLLTVDAVTAGTALGLELLALPWCGVGPRALVRRLAAPVLAAVTAGGATALFGVHAVSAGSAAAGLAIALRVLAIAVPGVVLLATTDPTDLADALAQVLRLPARFVLAALAAFRLFGVLEQEWAMLRRARRARGLGDDGLLGRSRTVAAQLVALLVLALRRATILATAMEARGFGTRSRTWARPSRLAPGDLLVLGGGLVLACSATTAGIAAGTWHLLLA